MATLALMVDGVVVQRFELEKNEVCIGRNPDCDIQINDNAVSGNHAIISIRRNHYMPDQTEVLLQDLGSTNGTFVNDIKVKQRLLSNDDEVRVAWNTFKFIDSTQPNLERTAIMVGN
jgi:pSer/pThr/pTyr-binding forkhead associated (FHA) protein